MKERPILFSAPMVRALLNGTKTQTRRVVKCHVEDYGIIRHTETVCPYGQFGDRLWVRETWWRDEEDNSIIYRVDANSDIVDVNKHETGLAKYNWRPSIFMPRAASRITLEITAVRVDRLQDISEGDARAEGARNLDVASGRETLDPYSRQGSCVAHYKHIWQEINGPDSWDANPWVWVIEFKKVTA